MLLVCVYFGSKFLEFSILEVEGDHTKNVLLHAIITLLVLLSAGKLTCTIFRVNGDGVCITAWRDNKLVVAASTAKGVEPCHQVLRFSRKEKRRISLPCPDVIHHYNHSMGGVDLSDSHVARCRSGIRGKKWYFPIFIYLFDLSVSNAWILYRLAAGSSVDLASFKAEIASILLRSNRKGRATTLSIDRQSRFDRIDHLVIYNDRQARCGVCSKCTNFYCKKCHKFLHPKLCFESFHTK